MGLFDKLFGKKKPLSEQFTVTVTSHSSFPNQEDFSEEKWQAAVNAANEKFDKMFKLTSEQEIAAIDVYYLFKLDESFDGVTSCWNILNKKATAFKREKRMDLAIACLRKLNEYMDASGAAYSVKDYLRLSEFLKQDRQFEEARKIENIVFSKFPEIFTATSHNHIDETMEKAKHFNEDLIILYANKTCPQCSLYHNRIFSISGKNKKYIPLSSAPDFLKSNFCTVCGYSLSFSVIFDMFLSKYPEIAKLNEQPIIDNRSEEQKKHFEESQLDKKCKTLAKIEYDYLFEHLPEICPKNLASYSRMKNSNSANFQKIVAAAKEKGFEIKIL